MRLFKRGALALTVPMHPRYRQSTAMLAAAVINGLMLTSVLMPARPAQAPAPVATVAPVKPTTIAWKLQHVAKPAVASRELARKAGKPTVVTAASEQQLLAKVVWHEARGQGRLGMLAAGLITLNRLRENHNGHKTLQSVVNEPYAYTWVKNPQQSKFDPDSLSGHMAMQVADRLLSHHLLADEQALADKLGRANHFHAVTMAKYPSWAFSPKLSRVKLSKAEEVALGAVFYAPRDVGIDVASR